jgi:hypothetical protein
LRAALLEAWPALSEMYGLYPWHADGGPPALTMDELWEYQAAAVRRAEAIEDAHRDTPSARATRRRG